MTTCGKCGSLQHTGIVDEENNLKNTATIASGSTTWRSTKRKWMSTTGEKKRNRNIDSSSSSVAGFFGMMPGSDASPGIYEGKREIHRNAYPSAIFSGSF